MRFRCGGGKALKSKKIFFVLFLGSLCPFLISLNPLYLDFYLVYMHDVHVRSQSSVCHS